LLFSGLRAFSVVSVFRLNPQRSEMEKNE